MGFLNDFQNIRPNVTAQPRDPISEPRSHGSPFLSGVTGEASPATHTVEVQLTSGGKPIPASILSRVHDSDMRGGEVYLPKPGSPVIVACDESGRYFILGYKKESSSSASPDATSVGDTIANTALPIADPATGGADDPLYKNTGQESHREGDAGDAGPGDWILKGSEGNAIGIMEGGVSIFRAGDLSQILGIKLNDLIRVVAKNLELFTGMGELRIVTEDKKARIEFKGSTDAQKAHPSNADWDVEAGIGGDASLFHLKFLNPGSGTVKAGITITKDGDILLEGRTISEHESASKTSGKRTRHGNDEKVRGSDTKDVGDTYARRAKTISRTAESGMKDEAGASYSLSASDISVNCSHASAEFVSGYRPEKDGVPIPGQVPGKTFTLANGNFTVNAGEPPAGLPASYPSVKLNTWAGDIDLTSNLAGSITLNTGPIPSGTGLAGPFGIILNAPQVLLGGSGVPLVPFTQPGTPICKFDMLLVYVNALHTALKLHQHPTMMGPAGPSVELAAALSGLDAAAAAIASITTRVLL